MTAPHGGMCGARTHRSTCVVSSRNTTRPPGHPTPRLGGKRGGAGEVGVGRRERGFGEYFGCEEGEGGLDCALPFLSSVERQ